VHHFVKWTANKAITKLHIVNLKKYFAGFSLSEAPPSRFSGTPRPTRITKALMVLPEPMQRNRSRFERSRWPPDFR